MTKASKNANSVKELSTIGVGKLYLPGGETTRLAQDAGVQKRGALM